MPTNQFETRSRKFLCRGAYTGPVDLVPDGFYPRLFNVRVRQPGVLFSRLGLFQQNYTLAGAPQTIEDPPGTALPVHSLKRVADDPTSPPGAITVAGVGVVNIFTPTGQLWSTAKTQTGTYAQRNYSPSPLRYYDGLTPESLPSPGNLKLTGYPLGMLPYRPGESAQSWCYIADGSPTLPNSRLPKISPSTTMWYWGIEPPNEPPSVAAGDPGQLVGKYSYRIRYRSDEGAISNSGARDPVTGEITNASDEITVSNTTIYVSVRTPKFDPRPDPQVAYIEVFRSSDALPAFRLLTTISLDSLTAFGPSAPTLTIVGTIISFHDDTPDLNIASSELLDDDNDVPWVTVNASGQLTRVNLPFVWGPFQGSFFGVGDRNRPGYLMWTKPYSPDSGPPDNNLEVTQPSEQLMNGFLWDGRCWVFSTERLFAIYPSFASPQEYDVQETPCGRGLFAPWAFAVGPKVWFLSRDGIYETEGGAARSITDESLYWLFPHGDTEYAPKVVNGIEPPNFSVDKVRLEYHKGYLYLDYVGAFDAQPHTLVYDTATAGWFYDTYQVPVRMHYAEEGRAITYPGTATDDVMVGGSDGRVYVYTPGKDGQVFGDPTSGTAYTCRGRTPADDFGNARGQKLYGDVLHEFDRGGETLSVQPLFDNESVTEGATAYTTLTGRSPRTLDINGGLGRLARNMALDFSWQVTGVASAVELYSWQISAAPKPDEQVKRLIEWHEFRPGEDAYVVGIVMWVDTEGQDVTFQVWSDLANQGITRTVNTSGEKKVAFSWPSFKGRLGRLVITTSNKWRVTKWDWTASPEPLLEPDFDTNWRDAIQGGGVGYVTGVQVTLDTVNVNKILRFQSQFEGTVTNLVPIGLVADPVVNHSGRLTVTYSFVPFRANQLRLFTTDQIEGRLYDVDWIVHQEPPTLTNWNANWTHDNYLGAKFVQGFVVDADTNNQNKTVLVEYEGGNTFPVTVNNGVGRQGKAYSFNPPFIATMLRARPTDANKNWFYGVRWVWEPHPEQATHWQTQGTSMDMVGYGHIKESYIALQSSGVVTMTVYFDGTSQTYNIASTNGLYRKPWIPMQRNKGKLYTYVFTGTCPFRIFKKDCEVRAKSWGDPGPYQVLKLFGGEHRRDGAAI